MAEVRVPDIGDFKDVPVIEVFVKPGDTVKPEEPLITLESDKATMDVPAPLGGVVGELKVKIGDKVSEGTVILTLVTDSAQRRRALQRPPRLRRPRRLPPLPRPRRRGRRPARPRTRPRSRSRTPDRACASSRASGA